jgi:glutathione synthase/RimK-type ligase-like ATP-grasp enzyme
LLKACGLCVPATLITNDPQAAAKFANTVGPVVYKPIAQNGIAEDGRYRLLYATVVEDVLDEPTIRNTAHLFQQFVTQHYAVRLTVIDDCLLAARIDAHSHSAVVDWRTDYAHLTYSVVPVPAPVRSAVHVLMRTLRLRFGALDFIVTPADEWVFLEINPNGQWGWIEDNTGLPIAATIADALTKE